MRCFKQTLAGLVFFGFAAVVSAQTIADSVADFSATQGANGWTYGYFNASSPPGAIYTVGAFKAFDTFRPLKAGENPDQWEASDADLLVGPQNNDYLSINANGGHPTGIGPDSQDSIIWAVRRYTSDTAGVFNLSFDLRKQNTTNEDGRGITGHIFVDGVEFLSELIANTDGAGVQDTLAVTLALGSFVDLAIAPTGTGISPRDGIHSARADGTIFSASIAPVPEPSEVALMLAGLGLVGLIAFGRNRRGASSRSGEGVKSSFGGKHP